MCDHTVVPSCEDGSVIGRPSTLMDFAEGRIFRDPSLPGLTPSQRHDIYTAMGEVMARLHAVDWRAAGLDNFGKRRAIWQSDLLMDATIRSRKDARYCCNGRTDRLAPGAHAGG